MINSKQIFAGRIIRLAVEEVLLPNGARAELEIVHHPGGASVVAVDETDRVCLLRQFRHAVGGWLWELPAGKLDAGEDPLQCAQRELEEEAGRQALAWRSLGSIVSSPGILTERIHLFLARRLVAVPARTEAHEVLEAHWLTWQVVEQMIQAGDIVDAKTLIGLWRARDRAST